MRVNAPAAPISRQQVVALLHHLGRDADHIAQTLQHHQVTGRPMSAAACPVARYLTQRTRGRDGVNRLAASVTRDYVEVWSGGAHFWVDASPAVHAFVARFDAGEFSELWLSA